jgi:excisionase family DNA binding protein
MPTTKLSEPRKAALQVNGACYYLNVSRSTLMRLLYSGELKSNRKLRNWLIPIAELDRWLTK